MKNACSLLSRRALHGALVTLAIVLLSSSALAFGSVTLKSTTIEEVDGRWKLEMDINYGSAPAVGHIPFDFVFTLTNYYEYSITDQDKEPVVRPKAMQNQQPQRESVDIDFADARNKIWPRTKFQIAIKRDRGFEAGEYTLQIKRADDGAMLGQPIHLRFNGKNKLVDRRAIVFSSPGSKAKPDAGAASEADAEPGEKKTEPTETKTEEPSPGDEPKAPPPVEKRPASHGCGCKVAEQPALPLGMLSLVGLGTAVFALRRRRTRSE